MVPDDTFDERLTLLTVNSDEVIELESEDGNIVPTATKKVRRYSKHYSMYRSLSLH